jgi:hypothetical protein
MTNNSTVLFAIACLIAIGYVFGKLRKWPKQVHETTPGGPYTLTITANEIACEHPKRDRESIRWDDVTEIRLVTTSDGPWQPDVWLLFVGDSGACSIPTEAKEFDRLWPELNKRFPGLDYQAILAAGTTDSQKIIWSKGTNSQGEIQRG